MRLASVTVTEAVTVTVTNQMWGPKSFIFKCESGFIISADKMKRDKKFHGRPTRAVRYDSNLLSSLSGEHKNHSILLYYSALWL